MKKIYTCSFVTLLLLLLFCSASQGQTSAAVRKNIEQANKHFINWFNSGKADSILTQYHPDACITGRGCGKTFIQAYYQGELGKYTFRELTTVEVTVNGNIATESGQWRIQLTNGTELTGKYKTEWQQVNTRWVIVKETVSE